MFKNVAIGSEDDEDSDNEVPVYEVGDQSSEGSEDSDIAVSDVEQDNNDDMPNARAWGKNKKHFYFTDYVDPDYGGYQGADAVNAELEEDEARNLQKQLMHEMDEDDFAFDFIEMDTKSEEKQSEEVVKTDISQFGKRQKVNLLYKESPEFFGLVEDFKKKITILKDYLFPIIKLWKKNNINDSNAVVFVRTYQELILNYCININMYLLLKASRVNVQNHPIIRRLFQYRKLLNQLDPLFENSVQKQIQQLLENNKNLKTKGSKNIKHLLKVLQKSNIKVNIKDKNEEQVVANSVETIENDEGNEKATMVVEEEIKDEDGDFRRAITYQIAKNKGLTPHRNKLQRNPRVKHRNKYRKALIRRKGAVRTIRTELTRYGGELSGIKASVSKSVKIKS